MKVLFSSVLALLLVVGLYGCTSDGGTAPTEPASAELQTVSLNIAGMT